MDEGYANKLSFLDMVSYEAGKMEQYISIMIYSVVGFFLPFVLSHTTQQLIVGSIVNLMIVMAAFHLKKWEAMPLMILPTIGVISAGALFGTFTKYLLYMMPFIWVGNFLLFAGVKKLYVEKKKNYALALPIAAIVKTALLFAVAFIFVSMGLMPSIFLTAMGIVQLVTALIGGIVAFGYLKAREMAVKN